MAWPTFTVPAYGDGADLPSQLTAFGESVRNDLSARVTSFYSTGASDSTFHSYNPAVVIGSLAQQGTVSWASLADPTTVSIDETGTYIIQGFAHGGVQGDTSMILAVNLNSGTITFNGSSTDPIHIGKASVPAPSGQNRDITIVMPPSVPLALAAGSQLRFWILGNNGAYLGATNSGANPKGLVITIERVS